MSNCNRGTAPTRQGRMKSTGILVLILRFSVGGRSGWPARNDSRGKFPSTTRNEEFAVARDAWGGGGGGGGKREG